MEPTLIKALFDGGSFALLAYLVVWGLPKLLDRLDKHGDDRDATFRAEMKAERDSHTLERTEDRKAFTDAIDRNSKAVEINSKAVETNTAETRALADLVRRSNAATAKI